QQVPGQGQVTVPVPVGPWQLELAFNRRSSGLWTHSVLLDELAGALARELVAAIGAGRPTPKVVGGGFGRTAEERAARQGRAQALADYLRTMVNGYALVLDVDENVLLQISPLRVEVVVRGPQGGDVVGGAVLPEVVVVAVDWRPDSEDAV